MQHPGCNIFVLNASASTGLRLHPDHAPCDWENHQFASEVWLDRALQEGTMAGKEPVWAVTDPAKADLIFITGLDVLVVTLVAEVLVRGSGSGSGL